MTAWKHSGPDGKDPLLVHVKPKPSAPAAPAAPAWRLTASGLSRAEACLGSVLLEGYSEAGEYAASGQAVDDFVRIAKTASRDAALKQAPEEMRKYLAALDLSAIPADAQFQCAWALNAETGAVRRIPPRSEGYPADMGPEWVFGSADVLYVRDGVTHVDDIKWGEYAVARDPATDLQLGMYGICARAETGTDEVALGFLRAGWDSVLRPESVRLDEFDLAAIFGRIRRIWLAAQAGRISRLNIGDHCTYCSARRSCPTMIQPVALALRAEIEQLAAAELPSEAALREKIAALPLVAKGRLYERIDVALDYLGLIKGIIRDDARQEPVPIGEGKALREVLWGQQQKSPAARARLEALTEELKAASEIMTVKVPQVRVMAEKKPPKDS